MSFFYFLDLSQKGREGAAAPLKVSARGCEALPLAVACGVAMAFVALAHKVTPCKSAKSSQKKEVLVWIIFN